MSELSKEEALLFNYTTANVGTFKKLLEPIKLLDGYFDDPISIAKGVLICHLVPKLNIDVDIALDFVQQLNVEELLC